MLELDLWTVLFSVINILVLYFFLKKFLFGRVNAMLEKRAAMAQADLDKAKEDAEDAAAMKAEYETALLQAKQEAKQIVDNAEITAREHGADITEQAQQHADHIIAEAHAEIEAERQSALDSVQSEIANLAMSAASRIVEKEVNTDSNRDLVDQFLQEEGADL